LPISSLIDVIANDDECDEFKVPHEIIDDEKGEITLNADYLFNEDY